MDVARKDMRKMSVTEEEADRRQEEMQTTFTHC